MTTEIIGIGAGTLTAISLIPQTVKLIKEKKAKDISLFYLVILLAGLAMWIWYGWVKNDLPILVTNIFSMIVNITTLVLGIRYKKRGS